MKNPILSLLFLLFSFSVFSQGWERFYGDGLNPESALDVVQLPNNDYLIATNEEGSIIRTNELGTEIWRKQLSGLSIASYIIPLPNGNFIISGSATNGKRRIMEIDADANVVWSKTHTPSYANEGTFFQVSDGYVAAYTGVPDTMTMLKVDLNGDSLFQKLVISDGLFPFGDAGTAHDGGFVTVNTIFSIAIMTKFDADGNFEWKNESPTNLNSVWHEMIMTQTSEGGYAAAANQPGEVHLLKFDGNGNLLLEGEFILPAPFENGVPRIEDIVETINGKYAIAGYMDDTADSPFILKFDGSGTVEFFHVSVHAGNLYGIVASNDGGFLGVGRAIHTAIGPSFLSYAIKLTENGVLYPNLVEGQVALDHDMDCSISSGDLFLEGWTVRAEGLFTFYDLTDANGTYSISIDTGEYTLSIFPPNDLWGPCENPVDITVALGDSLATDFPIQAAIECPAMQVDIGTPFLRLCFENTLTVQYCNLGTMPAEGATIEVTLDSLLEFVSSTGSLSGQMGNTYTFDIGDVGVMECGDFKITAFVNCDATQGQSLCMEAHAFPDSICGMPFNWSGASMEARAKCQGDSTVILELENVGSVPTSQPLEYIVIEDQIIFLQGNQTFDPAQVLAFSEMANGATWRVICEQEPGHPGVSFPTAFVEGCGTNVPGGFSTGFVNEHPLADGDGFIDIDCEEVVASFDPNDKTGYPIGYNDQHYIEANTDIEYRIRFQNTGTDTAFNIVIRDTLSPLLDPTTLRPGAASHDYGFDLRGDGIAVFTFPDIMLPDSNENEALSHGFVSFKISQQRDLPPGEVIYNSAAIYFDFNEPVITNETFHTIEKDFILTAIVDPQPGLPNLNIYPNPFSESATFEIKEFDNQPLSLHIFDTMGRHIREEKFTGGRLVFHRDGLPEGIWFFQIMAEGQAVASGKLVIVGH